MGTNTDHHGVTWHVTVDRYLERISTYRKDRERARATLAEFLEAHPEFESDVSLLSIGIHTTDLGGPHVR